MRLKTVIIAGLVVLALGLGGWTAAWFAGRGEVEDRIAELGSEFEAQGWSVSHGGAEISGFPTGYNVLLPDVALVRGASGELVRLPEVRGRWESTATGQIVLDLPKTFEATLPNSEEERQRDPSLPPVLLVRGQAESWRITIPTDDGKPVMTAAQLSAVLDQEDFATRATAVLTDMVVDLPQRVSETIVLSAEGAELDMRSAQEDGPVTTLVLRLSELAAQVDLGNVPFREVFYAGAEGQSRLQYAYANAEGTLEVAEDPLEMDGILNFSSGEGTGVMSVANGVVDLQAENRAATWALNAPDFPGGAVTLARAELAYSVPTAPSETPLPGRLKIALEEVDGAPELWAQLDPGGKLDQSAGNLVIDIAATVRLMARMDELPAGFAPPYEVSNMMLNQAFVGALGAEIEAAGDVEIVQPAMIPIGSVEMRAAGLSKVIARLAEAGLLSPEMRGATEAILQVYARPGAAPDTWESILRVGVDGVSVNGLPVP
ncbi:MAG: DUF2125 domain-containing protein [Pseudomonadota bacterium]